MADRPTVPAYARGPVRGRTLCLAYLAVLGFHEVMGFLRGHFNIFFFVGLLIFVSLFPNLHGAQEPAPRQAPFYVGTYTSGESQGIYRYRMDLATGTLTFLGIVPGVVNPSFLAIHPSARYLYAVNEVGEFRGEKAGAVSSFEIDAESTRLRPLNQQSTRGGSPCYLTVDATGRYVLVANYSGGSVCVLPIREDGSLAEATSFVQHQGSSLLPRQAAPHAHSIDLDASNRIALVADLGLDKILLYDFDPSAGVLTPHRVPWVALQPGSGPRHLAFHPSQQYVYVTNEIDSTVTVFRYNRAPVRLKKLQRVSTLPAGFKGDNTTAEILADSSGRHLYVSNRGHNSLAVFKIDQKNGKLKLVQCKPTQGKVPRNFEIAPGGRFLLAANQNSNTVVVFPVNPENGRIGGALSVATVPSPVCIRFLPVQ